MTLYDLPDEIVSALFYFTKDNQGPFLLSEIPQLRAALEHPIDADSVLTTTYRALLPNGSLWAESRDMHDVLTEGMLAGKQPVTYEAKEVWVLEQPWRPLEPSEEQLAAARKQAHDLTALLEDE